MRRVFEGESVSRSGEGVGMSAADEVEVWSLVAVSVEGGPGLPRAQGQGAAGVLNVPLLENHPLTPRLGEEW